MNKSMSKSFENDLVNNYCLNYFASVQSKLFLFKISSLSLLTLIISAIISIIIL
jgi:hypothetical protein